MRQLIYLLFALISGAAHGAITVPQSTAWTRCTSSPCTAATFSPNPSAASAIITVVGTFGAANDTNISVAENSVTYTKLKSVYDSGSNRTVAIFCRPNIPGGQTIAPVVTQSGASDIDIMSIEVAGADTGCSQDGTAASLSPVAHFQATGTDTVTSGGANSNTGSIALSIIYCRSDVASQNNTALPSGWTSVFNRLGDGTGTNSPAAFAYKIETTTETSSAAWVGTGQGNGRSTNGAAVIANVLPASTAAFSQISPFMPGP